jgi:hypothetical protein
VAAISVGRDDTENEHDAHTESVPVRLSCRLNARVSQQLGVKCLDFGIAYAKLDRPYERCPWIDELNTEFSVYLPDWRSNLPF